MGKKLTAVWRIIQPRRSLLSKMELVLFLQDYYKDVVADVEAQAVEEGQIRSLEALRDIVVEKMKNGGK